MAAIEELSADLDRAEVIAGVEHAAGLAASRSAGRTLRVRLDQETGILQCFASQRVVAEVADPEREIHRDQAPEGASEGDLVEVPAPLRSASRNAAWAARETLETKLRAGRLLARANRFRDRIGKLETGRVLRREGHDLIVDLGPVEGRLPGGEQSRHEVFNPDDTVRAVVRSIEPEDPPVILSRIAPEVVAGAIERETPEVRRGLVEVRAVARHPGTRAKAAVWSEAPGVDAVAACLGPGGARIRAVSRELRGERVDVVRWSPTMEGLARNALRPAEVLRVERATGPAPSPDRGRRRRDPGLIVTVSEAELPRAVGKRGENVRLASELLGIPIEVIADGDDAPARPRRSRRPEARRPGNPRGGDRDRSRGRGRPPRGPNARPFSGSRQDSRKAGGAGRRPRPPARAPHRSSHGSPHRSPDRSPRRAAPSAPPAPSDEKRPLAETVNETANVDGGAGS